MQSIKGYQFFCISFSECLCEWVCVCVCECVCVCVCVWTCQHCSFTLTRVWEEYCVAGVQMVVCVFKRVCGIACKVRKCGMCVGVCLCVSVRIKWDLLHCNNQWPGKWNGEGSQHWSPPRIPLGIKNQMCVVAVSCECECMREIWPKLIIRESILQVCVCVCVCGRRLLLQPMKQRVGCRFVFKSCAAGRCASFPLSHTEISA